MYVLTVESTARFLTLQIITGEVKNSHHVPFVTFSQPAEPVTALQSSLHPGSGEDELTGSPPGPAARPHPARLHSDDDDQSPSHLRCPGESQAEHEDQEAEAESRQQEEEGGETEEESSSTAKEGSVDVKGERFER